MQSYFAVAFDYRKCHKRDRFFHAPLRERVGVREVSLDAPLAHQFSENLEIDEFGGISDGMT